MSGGLLNYKDASGVWQRIDTTLIASATSGEMRSMAGRLTFWLPAAAGAARVDASGASLTMSIRGASRSPRIASGSSASYASALPGIDASYRVTSTGLDESLLVQQRPTGPLSITYDLAATGLALSANADGSVNAFDASGGLAFLLPGPGMREARGGTRRPGPPNSNVAVSLTGGAGRYQLTYTPDQAWLQDPARRYPLTLDPSVTINPSLGGEYDSLGAYIPGSSPPSFPTWCCGGWSPNWEYPVGYDAGSGWIYRWVISFDGAANYGDITCPNCYVTSAALYVDQFQDLGHAGANLYVYGSSGRAWGQRPNPWSDVVPVGSASPAKAVSGSGWIGFGITGIVQGWETNATAGLGTLIMTGDEGACCNSGHMYAGTSGGPPIIVPKYPGDSITSPAPDPITAQPGAIVSIPLQITNTSSDGFVWHANDLNDVVRIGVLQYQTASGNWSAPSNAIRTFLPGDVSAGGVVNTTTLIQAPTDPGDYWYQVDLLRDLYLYPTTAKPAPIWFSTICGTSCNQAVLVHVRVVAPGDAQSAEVSTGIGDGTSLGVNTSNGSATLSATDLSIAELGSTGLTLSRTYNGINGAVPSNGTGSSNQPYGVGWTYNFQSNLQVGPWSTGGNYATLRNGAGLYTDSSGKTWPLVWNSGRGLWEDAAGGRTVPAPTPADLLQRQGNALQADSTAPFGHGLYLGGAASALIFQAGSIPTLPGGTVETWFKPDHDMSGEGAYEYTLFSDSRGYWLLNLNGSGHSHQWCFRVYNPDAPATTTTCSAVTDWTVASGWHPVAAPWSAAGLQLFLGGAPATPNPVAAGFSPMGDMYFGYPPRGAYAILRGAIAGLRIDSSVLSTAQISSDAASKSETPYASTRYLGTFVNSPNSAVTTTTYTAGAPGFDVLTNTDQTQHVFDPGTGRLVATRDRLRHPNSLLVD